MLQSKDCKIKVVSDVSCDINGPIACTLRTSTIENYLWLFSDEHKEVDVFHPAAVVVMAVDNLLRNTKTLVRVLELCFFRTYPAFFNGDKDGVLARAKMTEKEKTPKFSYLQDYVDGK
jgi:hypothetical protein